MIHPVLLGLLLAGQVHAGPPELACGPESRGPRHETARGATVRVLFLGNSHTYVNRLPCLVQHLAASLEPRVDLEAVAIAYDGATLEQHWADPSTRKLLESRDWDILVLQEQGRRPVESPDRTRIAVRQFAEAGGQSGVRVVLYIPPVARGRAAELERVTSAYRRIAAAAQISLAPAAQAWAAARHLDPTPDLYDPDGVHASAIGSYLTACVVLGVITGRSPEGAAPLLLRRPYGTSPATAAVVDTLARSHAAALQAAAWRAVQDSQTPADAPGS